MNDPSTASRSIQVLRGARRKRCWRTAPPPLLCRHCTGAPAPDRPLRRRATNLRETGQRDARQRRHARKGITLRARKRRGIHQLQRALTTTSDDFPAVSAEAYPLVTGVVQSGWLTAFDRDRFQIYVKTPTTTSLSVVTTSTPAPTVEIRTSAGVLVASGTGSATAPSATTGFYLVDVWDPAGVARGYSVTATIGCAAGSNCDDLTTAPATAARYTWGDRFGGRLPSGASTATYTVALNANENAVFSLADNSTTSCQLALDLTPPATLVYFNNKPVFSWNDLPAPFDDNGPAAGNRGGFRRGAGGHVTAPITGTYTLTVRRQNPGVAAACHYRLFVGHSTILSTARPQW